jgi:DNA processing protein
MRTSDETHRAWIALNLVPTHPLLRWRLAQECGGPLAAFRLDRQKLRAFLGTRSKLPDRIAALDWRARADREIQEAERHGVTILSPESPGFPSRLLQIDDVPSALYLQGELRPQDDLSVAVVGSRRPTPYGIDVAERLGRDLAADAVTVVSGLAYGIDAAAHRGALEARGRTIAVLGTGLDVLYPRGNVRLRRQIARQGALVSEFPMGTEAAPFHFPQRNRLIAALTLGTVVVEAAARSGALITADHALDFGREVFAVPGRLTSNRSDGAHALIREGAWLIRGADDVVCALPPPWGEPFRARRDQQKPAVVPAPADLPDDQARVLARLGADQAVAVDELARDSGLPVGALLEALVALEVRRLVRPLPGGSYLRASREPGGRASV